MLFWLQIDTPHDLGVEIFAIFQTKHQNIAKKKKKKGKDDRYVLKRIRRAQHSKIKKKNKGYEILATMFET